MDSGIFSIGFYTGAGAGTGTEVDANIDFVVKAVIGETSIFTESPLLRILTKATNDFSLR